MSSDRPAIARAGTARPGIALAMVAAAAIAGCGQEREMAESVELADTTTVVEAMHDEEARDELLDTMPGGEMARGDSAAEMDLLKKKM